MTETTTATESIADNLIADALRDELEPAKSLATIEPNQQRFTEDQVAILRQLGIEEATDGDLNLFFHYCRTTGLDPFRKQIYMIGRNTKVSEWVDDDRATNGRRKVERWVTKYTIQTGIDGYRRNGREAAKGLGDELTFDGPYFTGEDDFHVDEDGKVIQHWREVWPKGKPPHAAKYVIVRNGEPFDAIVHFDEFVQTGYQGEPNSMWSKMPRNQIAKCAEALAWRRAYPDDFAGLILEDSAQPTVIDQNGNVEQRGSRATRTPGPTNPVTVDEILGADQPRKAAAKRKPKPKPEPEPAQEPMDVEVQDDTEVVQADVPAEQPEPEQVEQPATAEPESSPPAAETAAEPKAKSAMRNALEKRLFALLGNAGLTADTERENRLIVYRRIIGRTDIQSTDDLNDVEATKIADQLYKWSSAEGNLLDSEIRDILNNATLAEEAASTETEGK